MTAIFTKTREEDDGYDGDDDGGDSLLLLTGVVSGLTETDLEEKLSLALGLPSSSGQVSVFEMDSGSAQFLVTLADDGGDGGGPAVTAEDVSQKINEYIQKGGGVGAWLTSAEESHCSVAEMEEEVFLEEDEALEMWRDLREEERTGHLPPFPSPDGAMVTPSHEAPEGEQEEEKRGADSSSPSLSPIASQLRRDPGLLEFDNVPRVDISEIDTVSWTEPVVITGALKIGKRRASEIGEPVEAVEAVKAVEAEEGKEEKDPALSRLLSPEALVERFPAAEVRTGNRATLAENGFVNSKPMALSTALIRSGGGGGHPDCSRIVFSPVKELPEALHEGLAPLIDALGDVSRCKGALPAETGRKFTLCLGREGFGIGFHRHNAAMFLLAVGQKRWYMGSSETVAEATDGMTAPTHPGFYRELSTHKVIQRPGELLFVPDRWWHEIFNLEYTAGAQVLPGDEM